MTETLGNPKWLKENETALKALLPKTWTHIKNLNGLQIGFGLKLLGVDWRSEQEFGKVMIYLERIGFMERQNGYQVKAAPSQPLKLKDRRD